MSVNFFSFHEPDYDVEAMKDKRRQQIFNYYKHMDKEELKGNASKQKCPEKSKACKQKSPEKSEACEQKCPEKSEASEQKSQENRVEVVEVDNVFENLEKEYVASYAMAIQDTDEYMYITASEEELLRSLSVFSNASFDDYATATGDDLIEILRRQAITDEYKYIIATEEELRRASFDEDYATATEDELIEILRCQGITDDDDVSYQEFLQGLNFQGSSDYWDITGNKTISEEDFLDGLKFYNSQEDSGIENQPEVLILNRFEEEDSTEEDLLQQLSFQSKESSTRKYMMEMPNIQDLEDSLEELIFSFRSSTGKEVTSTEDELLADLRALGNDSCDEGLNMIYKQWLFYNLNLMSPGTHMF